MKRTLSVLTVLAASSFPAVSAAVPVDRGARQDRLLADYFRDETAQLSGRCLADIRTIDDWTSRRAEYRRQLQEMLGLWPWPERSDLKPVITGKLEQDEFTVEKLHFQALPQVYVTANLYVPKGLDKPAPAILYVCGHSRVVTNGVSCGNKAGYQHHGAWFARNGYVCLMIDTVQLGEIQGLHHGTYREGQWWWNARGYTPAGVEAWFGIRAIDYLCSRSEVDAERVGMTGRSGGGSYTWTVAALDDRIKVAAPIAGMTDLHNQVLDGVIEGHCDCMFFLNTYRWDFPQVAALIAPRPLLIGNSDKDTIFPLDGVVRLYYQTRRIYQLYGKTNQLGLLVTDGPHADTQDLQLPVFRWFNRFLKGQEVRIEMAAKPFFTPAQLRVFDTLPADERNSKLQEWFVPKLAPPPPPAGHTNDGAHEQAALLTMLREKVFDGWPAERPQVKPSLEGRVNEGGLRHRRFTFESQPGVELELRIVQDPKAGRPQQVVLTVLDAGSWTNSSARSLWLSNATTDTVISLRREIGEGKSALVFFAPRLVEPSPLLNNLAKATHVRRRYMLLGQTVDGMRVWDIRCAARALRALPEFRKTPIRVRAQGEMGVNAAYAALFEPDLEWIELARLPASHQSGPDYLNVLRILDIPQAIEMLGGRVRAGSGGL